MARREDRVTDSATITVGTVDDEAERGPWRLVAAVGVVALAFALVVGVVPRGYVPQIAVGLGETLRGAVLVGGGLLGLFGLYSLSEGALTGGDDGNATRTGNRYAGTSDPIELATLTRERLGATGVGIGRELDAELERIGGLVDETSRSESYRAYKVQQNLGELAVRVLTSETAWSASEARQRIETGAWTDDPRAAAFLSDETVVLPVTLRLTDWANGEAFRRQVEATVAELARYVEVEET